MTTFFTSDTHFGHRNIISYCNRPWDTVDSMDAGLVAYWNSVVSPSDVVYHLGDLSFYWKSEKIIDLVSQLNGNIYFIRGNHDTERQKIINDLKDVRLITELPLLTELKIEGQNFTLCHYPIEQWNRKSIHLHGHSHGGSRSVKNRMDVGVDCYNWKPIPIDIVMSTIRNQQHIGWL